MNINRLSLIAAGLMVWSMIFLSAASAQSSATQTTGGIAIPVTGEPLDLNDHLVLLEDAAGDLTIEDVSGEAYRRLFQPIVRTSANFGFSPSVWWVRFQLTNPSGQDHWVVVRQDYPLIDFIDLWMIGQDGASQVVKTGDRRLFEERPIKHRDFVFPVMLHGGESNTYYMRFQSDGAINIGLSVSTVPQTVESLGTEQLAYGIYYGGFMVLVLYNFLILLIVRDRSILYYLLYVLSYGCYFAIHNGFSYQFLWPNSPWWANQSLVVFLSLSLLWGLQFSRHFLNVRSFAPKLDSIALGLQALSVIGLGLALFLPYSIMIIPMAVVSLFAATLLLFMGLISALSGYRPAFYFVLAWGTLLVGVVIYMLKTFGLLPHTPLTHNAFQVGSLIEMVLLSLALASRVSELQRQSLTDPLTSIANRRVFDERLTLEFERSGRYGKPLSLLVIDIDHFKKFNDEHGHLKGDEALTVVAKKLGESARKTDLVSRYGGEEFAMILPDTSCEMAMQIAERLRQMIEEEKPAGKSLSISIGLCCTHDCELEQATAFFEAADKALYAAKKQGRNRVVNFREDDNSIEEAAVTPG